MNLILTVSLEVVNEVGLLHLALDRDEVTTILHTLLLSHLPLGLFSYIFVAAKSKLLVGRWTSSSHSQSGLCHGEKHILM